MEIIDWIIIGLPIPIVAGLVLRDTGRQNLSTHARCWWAIGSLCIFPIVPIIYLALRNKPTEAEEEELP